MLKGKACSVKKKKKCPGKVIKLGTVRLLIAYIFHLCNKKEFMLHTVILLVSNWKTDINLF